MKAFRINIVGLANKPHQFEEELGDEFLKEFESDGISGSRFAVSVVLDKHETFLEAEFSIKGSMNLVCDRSLEAFTEHVDISKKMVFKYGDEEAELSDEIVVIPRDTATLNLGQYIYEFIILSLPMKRLHPRFRHEEDEDEFSEGKMVYTSGPDDDSEGGSDEVDPRWEQLKKLK